MRRLVLSLAALAVVLSVHTAQAGVLVRIDKFSQRMTVAVDGRIAYVWPI